MKVFTLRPNANHFQNFVLPDEAVWGTLETFDGTPVAQKWTPLEVNVFRDNNQNARLPPGDFPTLGGTIPVFSETAVNEFGDMLYPNGEVLPLEGGEGKYYAYNVTRFVDALDEERSELVRFSHGGIMRVVKHEFVPQAIGDAVIFKLPQTPRMYVYVTQPFVDRVRSAGLRGFLFEEVFSG